MAGASYLWRRGSKFWFQIAVPKDLASHLGKTPLRLPLPASDHKDASRYARVLAGAAERWFSDMSVLKKRLGGLGALQYAAGEHRDPRGRILNALLAEIQDVLSPQAGIEKPKKRGHGSADEIIAAFEKRSQILEGMLAGLHEKARDIAREYADFVAETHERNLVQAERREHEMQEAEIDAERDQDRVTEIASMKRKLAASQAETVGLKDQIVAEGVARLEVLSEAKKTIVSADAAISEVSDLKDISGDLISRLDNRGPLLSECLPAFLQDRELKGVAAKEVAMLARKVRDFIDLIGDKQVAAYSLTDIQQFANKLTFLPERHTLGTRWENMSFKEIIEENQNRRCPKTRYLCEKTILTNYVGRVKTAIRWLCAENKVAYAFENTPTIRVAALGYSIIRHGLSYESVNRLLFHSARADSAEEIWMPLLALLTGARLGELVYFRGTDVMLMNGCYVLDLTRYASNPGGNSDRRVKNSNSRRLIVLHEKIVSLGFVAWAEQQSGWVFPAFHRYRSDPSKKAPRPTNAASKRFQRLFELWGLKKDRVEVFHALRHTYKDWTRAQKVEERTIALQTGHSLQGIAVQYGTKALRNDEMRLLAHLSLPEEWNLAPYDGAKERAEDTQRATRRRQARASRQGRERSPNHNPQISDWIGLPAFADAEPIDDGA